VRAIYTMDGVRGLERALEKGSAELVRRVEEANQTTARAVQRTAQALAPRREGDLIRAIKYAGKGLNWRVGLENVTLRLRGGNSAHQNPSIYGVWYELGFLTRNIQAHPFMKPAADREERSHMDRVSEAVNEALSEVQ
jgi:hypothetical protein